jgi:hypothetical protein
VDSEFWGKLQSNDIVSTRQSKIDFGDRNVTDWSVVDVEMSLFDTFTMVTLGIRETKKTLFEELAIWKVSNYVP